jgi:hypothetical protein
VRWSGFALVLALAVSCTGSGASSTCQDTCRRDAECHDEQPEEERSYRFDRDECEATCAALERDSKGRELVKAHAQCVRAANDCTAVRACN